MSAAKSYSADLGLPESVVKAQVTSWLSDIRCEGQDWDLKTSIKKAEAKCLPAVATLLRIFGTLPVTIATAERSFSHLRRLKTYLRATMGEERLTSLALIHAHKDCNIDINSVIDAFRDSKDRRVIL